MIRSLLFIFILAVTLSNCKKEDTLPSPAIDSFAPAEAWPGDPVTISGKNFGDSPQVYFNESLANITSSSTTSIVVSVPSDAKSGRIKVVAEGRSGMSSSDFVISNSKYFIISNTTDLDGHISTSGPDGSVTPRAYAAGQPPGDRFADAVLAGANLYLTRAVVGKAEVLDAASTAPTKSISFGKAPSGNYFKQIAFGGGRIVIVDRATIYPPSGIFDYEFFLKVVNPVTSQVDSIPIVKNGDISAIAHTGNKVFLGVVTESLQSSIRILDATTLNKIGELNLGTVTCNDMKIGADGNVLASLNGGRLLRISSADYSIIKDKSPGMANLSYNSSAFAEDESTGIIYFVAPTGFGPFVLKSYNPGTDAVATLRNEFISCSTMAFDKKNKLIIVGGFPNGSPGGVVTFYGTDGGVRRQINVPTVPSKILVKY